MQNSYKNNYFIQNIALIAQYPFYDMYFPLYRDHVSFSSKNLNMNYGATSQSDDKALQESCILL